MLRSNRAYEPSLHFRHRLECELTDAVQDRHDEAIKRERKRFTELDEKVRKFEDATGLTLRWGDRAADVAPEVVRHLANPDALTDEVRRHIRFLETHLDRLRTLCQVLQ
jgi:hypothetical protein